MSASKWALIQSGVTLDKRDTIKGCLDTIRALNPTSNIKGGTYITDQVYEVVVKGNYYTILWIAYPQ